MSLSRWILTSATVIGFCQCFFAHANEPINQDKQERYAHLSLVIDRQVMGVAEQLMYTLTVETEQDATVEFEPVNDSFGDFKVIDYQPFGPIALQDKGKRWQRAYLLEANEAGSLTIPAINVYLYPPIGSCLTADSCTMTAHGRRRSSQGTIEPDIKLTTDAATISVQTVLASDADLTQHRDVIAPIMLGVAPSQSGKNWSWMWAALVALGIVGVIFRAKRGTQKTVPNTQLIDNAVTPYDVALQALAQLKTDTFHNQGEWLRFHDKLSHILRQYFQQTIHINALQSTTPELVGSLRTNGGRAAHSDSVADTVTESIADLFKQCDLVKFAGRLIHNNTHDAASSAALISSAEHIVNSINSGVTQSKQDPGAR